MGIARSQCRYPECDQFFGAGSGVYGVPLPMNRLRVASATALHNASPSFARSALHCVRSSFNRSGLAANESTVSVLA